MASGMTIRLELERARCGGCGGSLYRFSDRERWRHVIDYHDERCEIPPKPSTQGERDAG